MSQRCSWCGIRWFVPAGCCNACSHPCCCAPPPTARPCPAPRPQRPVGGRSEQQPHVCRHAQPPHATLRQPQGLHQPLLNGWVPCGAGRISVRGVSCRRAGSMACSHFKLERASMRPAAGHPLPQARRSQVRRAAAAGRPLPPASSLQRSCTRVGCSAGPATRCCLALPCDGHAHAQGRMLATQSCGSAHASWSAGHVSPRRLPRLCPPTPAVAEQLQNPAAPQGLAVLATPGGARAATAAASPAGGRFEFAEDVAGIMQVHTLPSLVHCPEQGASTLTHAFNRVCPKGHMSHRLAPFCRRWMRARPPPPWASPAG